MRRFGLPGVITAVAAALLALLAFGIASSGTSDSLVGEVTSGHFPLAPNAHLRLQRLGKNTSQDLAGLRGHYVMLDFFAGWCDACQADAGIVKSAEQLLEKDGGTVLGVTYQDSTTDASSYMRHYHLSFPVLRDPNGNLASAYGVDGVPETFLINPQGKVVALQTYQLTSRWLTKTLPEALSKTA